MLIIETQGRGLYEITDKVIKRVSHSSEVGESTGVLHLFLQHTSCSLIIQENADPSARRDLERFFCRLAPDDQDWHEHTAEGVDDTSSHMKAAVSPTSLSIPLHSGRLQLGTWQGIYLCEHRLRPHTRRIALSFLPGFVI